MNLKSSDRGAARPGELLTIGEVSRRSGVAASALRFYEQRGLITSERAGSGHRRYPRPVLRRIAFIVFAQRIGLTLDEIGTELAKLPPDRAPTRRDWSRLSSGWTARIDDRIAELHRLKAGLTECIGCGCLSLERCQLANPRDRAAASAPGRATGSATGPSRRPAARCPARACPRSIRSITVSTTFTRAYLLLSASTRCHGAASWSVRAEHVLDRLDVLRRACGGSPSRRASASRP